MIAEHKMIWREGIFKPEDIVQQQSIPKYIKLNQLCNDTLNASDNLDVGNVFEVISILSEPCVRCKFISKKGKIQQCYGDKNVLNIPLCYPDKVINFQTEYYYPNIRSLARHKPTNIHCVEDPSCPLSKLLASVISNRFSVSEEINGFLILESSNREIYLPIDAEIEFKDSQHCESYYLRTFIENHLLPQYVKFLNTPLTEDIFQIEHDTEIEMNFVFDQYILICEQIHLNNEEISTTPPGKISQWAFPTMYTSEQQFKSSFKISEETLPDITYKIDNLFEKTDLKTLIQMMNSPTFCCKFDRSSILRERSGRGKVPERHINPVLGLEQVVAESASSHSNRKLRLSRQNSILGDITENFPDTEEIKWSNRRYSFEKLRQLQPLPKYLKFGGYKDMRRAKRNNEFKFSENEIYECKGIHSEKCIRATFISQSNTILNINIPHSYPYLVADITSLTTGHTLPDSYYNSHGHKSFAVTRVVDSLKNLSDARKGCKFFESENQFKNIRFLEVSSDSTYSFSEIKDFSNEIELIGEDFEQFYIFLEPHDEICSEHVICPASFIETDGTFYISKNYHIGTGPIEIPILKMNLEAKIAASNFPFIINTDNKDSYNFIGNNNRHRLTSYASSSASSGSFETARSFQEDISCNIYFRQSNGGFYDNNFSTA